jgi:hypothetical protein
MVSFNSKTAGDAVFVATSSVEFFMRTRGFEDLSGAQNPKSMTGYVSRRSLFIHGSGNESKQCPEITQFGNRMG